LTAFTFTSQVNVLYTHLAVVTAFCAQHNTALPSAALDRADRHAEVFITFLVNGVS